MALIQCPVCGKSISENAPSCPHCGEPLTKPIVQNVVYQNGTEYFSVTEENRIKLTAKTDAKIHEMTARLASNGKIVTHAHVSDPQPFKFGVFTYWRNNVTLTWRGDPNEPRFKDYCYRCAKAKCQNASTAAAYAKAIEQLKAFAGYKDADTIIASAQESIDALKRAEEERRELEAVAKAAGKPGEGWIIFLIFATIFLLTSGITLCVLAPSSSSTYSLWGVAMIIAPFVFIAIFIFKSVKAKHAVKKYIEEKQGKARSETND